MVMLEKGEHAGRRDAAPRPPWRSACVHTGTTVVLTGVLSCHSGTYGRRAVRLYGWSYRVGGTRATLT